MTNSQAAAHENWMVRCSLTLRDLAEATRMILTMGGSPFCSHGGPLGCHVPAQATYTPTAIPVARLPPLPSPGSKTRIYINPSVSN